MNAVLGQAVAKLDGDHYHAALSGEIAVAHRVRSAKHARYALGGHREGEKAKAHLLPLKHRKKFANVPDGAARVKRSMGVYFS